MHLVMRLRGGTGGEGIGQKRMAEPHEGQPAKMGRVNRQLASVSRVELMYQYSWALTSGSGDWTCQSCSTKWNCIPVEQPHPSGVVEVAVHIGPQQHHWFEGAFQCYACRVQWQ